MASTPEQQSSTPPRPRPATHHDDSSPIHPLSLAAGAAAAAVAAVIGGRLGLSGTVTGAAVGSIVAAFVSTMVRGTVSRGRVVVTRLTVRPQAGTAEEAAEDEPPSALPAPIAASRHPWLRTGALTVGGFAAGITLVLLVQQVLGIALSPGTRQLQAAATRAVAPAAPPSSGTPSTITPTSAPSTESSPASSPAATVTVTATATASVPTPSPQSYEPSTQTPTPAPSSASAAGAQPATTQG